jgi:small subunit ribosomal protein S1
MSVQEDILKHGEKPMEPDESWWTAVLADEPCIEEPVEMGETVVVVDRCQSKPDHLVSLVNWDKVSRIFENDEIVTMNVVSCNRGGVLVAGEDIHGFVPASHLIDLPIDLSTDDRDQYLTSYLERRISLKVIECEPDKERIVLSERAALAREGQRKHLLKCLKVGDIVNGIVTNVTSFGAFVDLGGIEGLVHVSELSWGRVQHPSDILKVDQAVKTVVLDVSEDKGRIALSIKQLQENPWNTLVETLNPGDIVNAIITCIVKYGAFARLIEGVEGLIHISSLNFPSDCSRIDDFLFEGQPVKVIILNIDSEKRRLGLKLASYSSE